MVAIHKISEDFYDEPFTLIALHSSIADFSLAYALNYCLKIKLKGSKKDLEISPNGSFPFFKWRDGINYRDYLLIGNKGLRQEELHTGNLFQDQPSMTAYRLIPEYKDVDYFFRIEQDEDGMEDEILKSVLTIPKVIAAYCVDTDKMKSRNNLIF